MFIKAVVVPESLVEASSEQVSTQLAEEAVILNLKDGTYYGLNPVAAYVWELIQVPQAVSDIVAAVREQYDVEEDRCLTEVVELLTHLADLGLIIIRAPAG